VTLAQKFAKTGFARFVNSPTGRVVRIVAGIVLLVWGYTQRANVGGMVLMAAGLIPLAAGGFDWCLISALLGGPIRGTVLRQTDSQQGEPATDRRA
jgi:hypothetical protein